jgi:metallophosphoesterase superfamily enzyme
LAYGEILFRHAPQTGEAAGEIAGHLHLLARVAGAPQAAAALRATAPAW